MGAPHDYAHCRQPKEQAKFTAFYVTYDPLKNVAERISRDANGNCPDKCSENIQNKEGNG